MTGGLQEQVTNGKEWFGIGLEPSSKSVIGSQDVPFIYEDRLAKKDFVAAMVEFSKLSKDERSKMGKAGRQHVLDNYGFDQYSELWKKTLDEIIEKNGSWNQRRNYKNWSFEEIK